MEIQIWISSPLLLITVCEMTRLPLGCNPAWGLAYQLVWGINNSNYNPMNYLWSIIVGPIIGGIIAGLFF